MTRGQCPGRASPAQRGQKDPGGLARTAARRTSISGSALRHRRSGSACIRAKHGLYPCLAVAAIIHDLPPEELRFHWKSGRVCLDFVATVGERWRRSFERLLGPEDLARWLVDSGLLPEPPRVSERQLRSGRLLREAINRLARPDVEPHSGDRLELNRWAARAPLAPQLTEQGGLVWLSERPVEAALATIARDSIDLLTGPLGGRIRECAAPDCALLFVDSSRPGQRRWCAGEACGNRTRTKAYRQRRREQR
jgi:predicted RNA-binding Zn ribbon-like protein